ncbi:MAG TPA: DUF1007 family protein [Hyphomicrobiaceae bacterium]|nr:DUF1007 family protein [Hyphomicrobiaceae bacterium]
MGVHAKSPVVPRCGFVLRSAVLGMASVALALAAPPAAFAHPHVWIAVQSTILYDNGTITGIAQRWIFDEFYTASAVQGLDANNNGIYERSELAELAQLNIDGLKEFDYFTYANLAGQPLAFEAPRDYWLEVAEVEEAPGLDMGAPPPPPQAAAEQEQSIWTRLGRWWSRLIGLEADAGGGPSKTKVLTLNFTLPLKEPVLSEAEGFEFAVQDPSYFIWFDFAKDNPVRLSAAAPAGCKATVGAPQGDVQRLADAFKQFGGAAYGATASKAVTVSCAKS